MEKQIMTPQSNVFNMDCMEGMKDFPDKFWDLAVVDPPYGIGDFAQSDRRYSHKIEWNKSIPSDDYFNELIRVSKDQIIWGANYYNCFLGGAIVWDKMNQHPSMSRCEIASYSGQKKVDYVRIEWHGYKVKQVDPDSFHPCAKPIALYQWLLKNYAKPGDKILDTHMGSQSSRIAAYKMGFDYWGYEIDKQYFDEGCERFDKSISEPLFDQPKTEQGKLL